MSLMLGDAPQMQGEMLMRSAKQARKNEWKARDRAYRYGIPTRFIVGPHRPRLYAAIIAMYTACPKGYEVDHIVPLAVGGPHHPRNLQILPADENRRKGSSHEENQ